jgi:quinoprotein glucose dehydrogenase
LRNLEKKYTPVQVASIIEKGKGVMPAFTHLSEQDRQNIMRYVLDLGRSKEEKQGIFERAQDIYYSNTGYNRFLTAAGYPAVKPPWGTLNAIDLQEGKILWQKPLGQFPELVKKGLPPTGTENYGGSVVTKGGLIFIAASRDEKIRAFDKDTGEILWEHPLPAGGYATPSVFQVDGREYVVIACGGGKMGTKSGDTYLAFALSEE